MHLIRITEKQTRRGNRLPLLTGIMGRREPNSVFRLVDFDEFQHKDYGALVKDIILFFVVNIELEGYEIGVIFAR